MINLKPVIRAHLWEAGFALCLALLFAYLALRHAGAYPSVFADEQGYSYLARLIPLSEVTIPSYLYLSLYGLTSSCGNGFLECARYINLLFFIGAAPLIYLSTRELGVAKPLAAMAALMSVAAPAKTYTAYFMPEAMYFFGFALLTWVALTRSTLHWARYAMAAGAVLGLMTLVKVHALFLVPALAAFMLYQGWNRHRDRAWLRIGIGTGAASLAVGSVFAVKFGIGYAFGGAGGLQLLGSLYGNQAGDSVNAGTTLLTLMPAALFSLKGHLLMLVLLFSLPLAMLAWHLLSPAARRAAGPHAGALVVYAILMIGAALALTVLYTASTAGYGPLDGLRLHARYYNFTLMLLPMIAAALTTGPAPDGGPVRAAVAMALAGLLVFATVALPESYLFLLADGPEIVSLGLNKEDSLVTAILALQVAILALWSLRPGMAGPAFLFLLLPLFMFNGEKMTAPLVARTHAPNPFDTAGRFVLEYLDRAQRNELTIAGDNPGELLRARFHADAPGVETMVLPSGWPLQPYSLPGRKSWLLVIGDHALPPGVTPVVKQAHFALVRTEPDNRPLGAVKMTEPLENALLSGADGLANAEGWGRWSNDDQVRLHFRQPLPKKLNLYLTMQAFGPNVGKDFKVRVGKAEAVFQLPPMPQEVHFKLHTDGMQKTVTIEVPQAVSPNELGMSTDTRRLGLGMTRVEIGTPEG